MFDFWENELSEEKTQELLDKCADEVRKRQLEAPVILFLEMHKPLSNVMAHLGVTSAPFLVPLFGFDFVNEYSALLKKRDNVEALITMLEEPRKDLTVNKPVLEEVCQ